MPNRRFHFRAGHWRICLTFTMSILWLVSIGCASRPEAKHTGLRISLAGIYVNDQATALAFYTGSLGFRKKADVPVGTYRWLTVVSPDEPDGAQLLLEPNANRAARVYQQALKKQGIPAAAFQVTDIQATYEKLAKKGVSFLSEPVDMGSAWIAIFDDTCGNLIQIYQEK